MPPLRGHLPRAHRGELAARSAARSVAAGHRGGGVPRLRGRWWRRGDRVGDRAARPGPRRGRLARPHRGRGRCRRLRRCRRPDLHAAPGPVGAAVVHRADGDRRAGPVRPIHRSGARDAAARPPVRLGDRWGLAAPTAGPTSEPPTTAPTTGPTSEPPTSAPTAGPTGGPTTGPTGGPNPSTPPQSPLVQLGLEASVGPGGVGVDVHVGILDLPPIEIDQTIPVPALP